MNTGTHLPDGLQCRAARRQETGNSEKSEQRAKENEQESLEVTDPHLSMHDNG